MALATTERNTTFRINELPAFCFNATSGPPVGVDEIIYKGTLAMKLDGAVVAPTEEIDGTAALLGIAQETYKNVESEFPLKMEQVYRRGQCFVENAEGLNACTAGDVGFDVVILDNYTVGQSGDVTSLKVRCVGLSADEKMVEIWIP